MPSKSAAQQKFMRAAAHNPAFARKAGIPQSVAKKFNAADQRRKFGLDSVDVSQIPRET